MECEGKPLKCWLSEIVIVLPYYFVSAIAVIVLLEQYFLLFIFSFQIILMSGLSKNALEELSSERGSDDRISHICNILRFAVLKKDRSCMAIGGPWNPADGGDPSVDDSALIQTAVRCVLSVICYKDTDYGE